MARKNEYYAGRFLHEGLYRAYANLDKSEINLNIKNGILGALVFTAAVLAAPLFSDPVNRKICNIFAVAGGLLCATGALNSTLLERKRNLVLNANALAWGIGSDKDRRNTDPTIEELKTFFLRRDPMISAVKRAAYKQSNTGFTYDPDTWHRPHRADRFEP